VVLITLVCCYAACWGPTKTQGVADVHTHIYGPAPSLLDVDCPWGPWGTGTSYVPLVIGWDEHAHMRLWGSKRRRNYYFWFFGYVAKLPFEREVR